MHVTAINIYPIKSIGGIICEHRVVESQGLRGDRRYMLVDDRARFITQRQFPRMALIHSESTPSGYRLTAPGLAALELPDRLSTGERLTVTVWNDKPSAVVATAATNDWFTRALGVKCRLVYLPKAERRSLGNGRGQPEDRVSFADGAPLLLTTEASLRDLNSRLVKPVPMQQFRPNLVIDGEVSYAEDDWRMLAVGECEFEVAWGCSRCILSTVNPVSGERDPERQPLATLKTYRNAPNGPLFGSNLIPRKLGRISVGDPVRIS